MPILNIAEVPPNAGTRAVLELHELAVFVGVASTAISRATKAVEQLELDREMISLAAQLRGKTPPPLAEEHFEALQKQAEAAEAFANPENDSGFPYLHSLGAIRIWSILDAAVTDVAVLCVQKGLSGPAPEAIARLKGPLLEFVQLTAAEQAQYLLDRVKDSVSSPGLIGISRYEAILREFDLTGPVPEAVRRALLELQQCRNVIVHRRAVVDTRFRQRCPWRPEALGSQLALDSRDFNYFRNAALSYACEISRRYGVITESEEKNADELIAKLADETATLEEARRAYWQGRVLAHTE